MKLFNRPLGRHTDRANEERRFLLDDDVNELGQRSTCVVLVGLSRPCAHLGQKQIDAEGSVLIHKIVLKNLDRFSQRFGSEADASNASKPSSVGDGCSQLWPRRPSHTSKKHRVLDAEELCDRSGQRHGFGASNP